MSKHTPGPWTVDETWMLIMGPGNVEIAAIHGGDMRADRQSGRINARLIAAAPDLLAACEEMFSNLAGPLDYSSRYGLMWTFAQAAIQKARGKD